MHYLHLIFYLCLLKIDYSMQRYNGDYKKVIKVGAILNSQANSLSEIVLKSAVERINYNQEYFIDPIIRYVSENDSFKTGQIACEMVKEGISALFGPESYKNNDIVESVAETLEIPQFQTFWNARFSRIDHIQERTIFNFYPDHKLYAKALATLVKEMHWNGYAILYEKDEGLLRLQEVLKGGKTDDSAVFVRKLSSSGDHRPLLKEIRDSSQYQIVLDCDTDHILDILQQAQEVDLFQEYHSYIFTSLDAHTLDFSKLKNLHPNITMLRLFEPNTKDTRNAIQDWQHTASQMKISDVYFKISTEKIKLQEALIYDAFNYFITVYSELDATDSINAKWLSCEEADIFEDGIRISSFFKVRPFHKGKLPGPLTGPISFNGQGRRVSFAMEVVELAKEGLRKTATWNSSLPDLLQSVFDQKDRQLEIVQQLSQKVFRVTSRLGPPYLMYRQPTAGVGLVGNNRFEGYSMDLIKGIADILNFTFEFELVPDNAYGSFNPKTKEWNGLIRQLLDRKADLAVCDLTITYERRRAVDFTMPFMTLGISILYSKQVKPPPEFFSFMHPLSLDIWLYMATAYLALTISTYLVARFAPGDWENPHPCNPSPEELENIWNIKNCLWLTLGSLMQQGCDILPKGISTRMIAGAWWFFSLIMCASYTANMAAFLTMSRMGPTIESAEDLAKQTKIKYGCVSGGATASFFRDSNFSTYHRMWTQMETAEPSVFEASNKDGVKRVKTSKRLYAFLMESTGIEYEMERDCELMQVGGWLDTKGYGIAMPVNSPYRTAISGAVLKMQEDGKLHRLKEKWWKKMYGGGKCSALKHDADATAAELGVDNVGGIFVVLIVGIALALLVAIAEFLWNVRKVAVTQKISLQEAFDSELHFALQFSVSKKKTLRNGNGS